MEGYYEKIDSINISTIASYLFCTIKIMHGLINSVNYSQMYSRVALNFFGFTSLLYDNYLQIFKEETCIIVNVSVYIDNLII